uniref:Uncharacterized protein n=1 Tax=Glossina brevipalpis TaxID=37001 RepID=A0A1A9WSF7_9MUSC
MATRESETKRSSYCAFSRFAVPFSLHIVPLAASLCHLFLTEDLNEEYINISIAGAMPPIRTKGRVGGTDADMSVASSEDEVLVVKPRGVPKRRLPLVSASEGEPGTAKIAAVSGTSASERGAATTKIVSGRSGLKAVRGGGARKGSRGGRTGSGASASVLEVAAASTGPVSLVGQVSLASDSVAKMKAITGRLQELVLKAEMMALPDATKVLGLANEEELPNIAVEQTDEDYM